MRATWRGWWFSDGDGRQQPITAIYESLFSDISQNVLDPSRDYLFETRLTKLLRNEGMNRVDELVRTLRAAKNPELERAIAEAMTINETSFFRDVRPFELLRTELLPRLIEERRWTRTLRFWSAACATGQEAYSLAMLLLEHFPMLAGWKLRIEGTDLSNEVVERAQAGRYHRIEINRGLPARFVVRYFDRLGEDWTVKPEVRKLCNFRQANLCGPSLPFHRADDGFDVIFLAQRDALLRAGDSAHAAGRGASAACAGRHSLSRRQRATGRYVSVDSRVGGGHELLPEGRERRWRSGRS